MRGDASIIQSRCSFVGESIACLHVGPELNHIFTKRAMIPLCFSSTRSQIILLLKYGTGSHCKWNISKKQAIEKQFSVCVSLFLQIRSQESHEYTRNDYFNPLHLVLLLLGLEGELDEKLLQLLVAVVDAKLLEAENRIHHRNSLRTLSFHMIALEVSARWCVISPVDVENLEAIDVQQTNHRFPGGILQTSDTDMNFGSWKICCGWKFHVICYFAGSTVHQWNGRLLLPQFSADYHDLAETISFFSHLVSERFIDLVDQPVESAAIDGFGKGIPGIYCMVHREGTEHL